MKLGEYESLADVWRWVELLRDHDRDVVTAAAVAFTTDEFGDALENLGGVYDQAGEHAVGSARGVLRDPKELAPYIDWEAMEHDMECSDENPLWSPIRRGKSSSGCSNAREPAVVCPPRKPRRSRWVGDRSCVGDQLPRSGGQGSRPAEQAGARRPARERAGPLAADQGADVGRDRAPSANVVDGGGAALRARRGLLLGEGRVGPQVQPPLPAGAVRPTSSTSHARLVLHPRHYAVTTKENNAAEARMFAEFKPA